MESALYGIFTFVGEVSEISLVRCAHSFDFRYFTNSCEIPVRARFPWSNLYILNREICSKEDIGSALLLSKAWSLGADWLIAAWAYPRFCSMKHTSTHSGILEIAEQFEDSIKRAMQSDESNEDMYEERSTAGTQDGEPLESDHEAQETVVYQDRRLGRGRGNRSQDIIACLRWDW